MNEDLELITGSGNVFRDLGIPVPMWNSLNPPWPPRSSAYSMTANCRCARQKVSPA